jgi:hypothetical protein
MALTHKIKTFEQDTDTTILVGFTITDDTDNLVFIIDKSIVKGSKTDNDIVQEAYNESLNEINAWVESKANLGMIWNPDTNVLE